MAETCPKCGYAGVEGDTCPRCRVSVSQYRAYLLRPQEKGFSALVGRIRKAVSPESPLWINIWIIIGAIVSLGGLLYMEYGFPPSLRPSPFEPRQLEQWQETFQHRQVQVFWTSAMGCGAAVAVQNVPLAGAFCFAALVAVGGGSYIPDVALGITASNFRKGQAGIVEVLGLLVVSASGGVSVCRLWRRWRREEEIVARVLDIGFVSFLVFVVAVWIVADIILASRELTALMLYMSAGVAVFLLGRIWKKGEIFVGSPGPIIRWRATEFRIVKRNERPLVFFFGFTAIGLVALGLLVGAVILTLW